VKTFYVDNITRVYTNYKKTNILSDADNNIPFSKKDDLDHDTFAKLSTINTHNRLKDSLDLYGILYSLPKYNDSTRNFYYMFMFIFSQLYSKLTDMLTNLFKLYILRDGNLSDNYIVGANIAHYQIYDEVNKLLIFKGINLIKDIELMNQGIEATQNNSCTIEMTIIYNLATNNCYFDLKIRGDNDGKYTSATPKSNYFTKLFSQPKIFFISMSDTNIITAPITTNSMRRTLKHKKNSR
jgi:hypothetical protein